MQSIYRRSTSHRIVPLTIVALACTTMASAAAVATAPSTTQPTSNPMSINLPDALVMSDGARVTTAAQWREKRRPELIELFTREMYGQIPPAPRMKFEMFDNDPGALDGKAIRRQVRIHFTDKPDGSYMDLLLYLPKNANAPVPVIFAMNFSGNHTVRADPDIRLSTKYVEKSAPGVKDNRATEASRGTNAKQWPIEEMLSRGFGFVTAYRCDIDPDRTDGFDESVKALYPELQNRGDNFSTIGAWAWAYSRGMDYLQTDPQVDAKRVAIFGFSRLGKAALWSAALDERFALVISNESGSGGSKVFHHNVGENIERLNNLFPHWYCQNFRKYDGQETTMPFDQNLVTSLIAPRPLYVGSSEGSAIFDPIGEYLGAKGAEPVYKLLGVGGLPADTMPPIDHPVFDQIGFHWRTGKHDLLPFDWKNYLAFADKHFMNGPTSRPTR